MRSIIDFNFSASIDTTTYGTRVQSVPTANCRLLLFSSVYPVIDDDFICDLNLDESLLYV
jgi:hypothetical protein